MMRNSWLPIGALCLAGMLSACAHATQEAHFRPEQGWSLCRAPMPIETSAGATAGAPASGWSEEQQTNIAGAVALALALRCDASATVAQQAQGYRGITAVDVPGTGRPVVHRDPATARLIVDVPAYADYRSDAFLVGLETAITCALAPDEAAAGSCLPG